MLSNVGLLFPVFLFINLGFLIFWLIFKVRYALIPFMGFIICYVPVREYIPFNIPQEAPEGSIKILSYNTWAFAEGEMGEDGINPIVKYIKEQNADIVCLQEAGHNGDVENQLDSLLYPMYAYRDTTWHLGGGNVVGILSKYPILSKERIPHILNLSVENVKGTVFQRELDAEGVCVSVKSACSSDGLPSRAVFAVSRDRKNALSSWRISLSHLTTQEELDGFLRAFDACCTRLTQL